MKNVNKYSNIGMAIAISIMGIMAGCVEEMEGNVSPTASFTYTPEKPAPGDTITFTDESMDTDGKIVEWHWNFDDDGEVDSTAQSSSHQYTPAGTYIVNLTVMDDDDDATAYCEKQIEVYRLGVLVVAHGFPGRWSQNIGECVSKVSLPVPVELGFLEYVPRLKIEDAVEKLKDQVLIES